MFEEELRIAKILCPYCGERIELVVDSSAGSQEYVEDCSVCCRPMDVHMHVDAEGSLHLDVQQQDA